MGLFDKLVKKVVSAVKGDEPQRKYEQEIKPQQYNTANYGESDIYSYFSKIINNNFNEYEIKKNVPVANLDNKVNGLGYRDYNYLLCKNGRLCCAIMLTNHNCDKNKQFIGAKNTCLNVKIPFLNFYTHFENEEQYVINRIKSALK